MLSKSQETLYNEEGWKHDSEWMQKKFYDIYDFIYKFRRHRDASPNAEEQIRGKVASL